MRDNNYIIDENDIFQIKPMEATDSEEEFHLEGACPVDLIGGRADSEEDWDWLKQSDIDIDCFYFKYIFTVLQSEEYCATYFDNIIFWWLLFIPKRFRFLSSIRQIRLCFQKKNFKNQNWVRLAAQSLEISNLTNWNNYFLKIITSPYDFIDYHGD